MVRALACPHTSVARGSIPRLGIICGLSFFVLYSAPRGPPKLTQNYIKSNLRLVFGGNYRNSRKKVEKVAFSWKRVD